MSRDLHILDSARRDLRRIYRWLESRSPRGAISWYRAFWEAANRIVSDPNSFSEAEETPRLKRPVRQALFKTRRGRRYRIIFDFSASEVFILRVRRPGERPLGKRDLPIR